MNQGIQTVASLIVIGTSIAVALDASRMGARRGALGGGLRDMGPAGWFFACLLLWIVALPCYLSVRGRLMRRHEGLEFLQRHPQRVPSDWGWNGASNAVATQAPPSGWYPDPSGRPRERWWAGNHWTNDFR